MIEDVIEFAPDLYRHSLVGNEILEQRDIRVVGARAAEYYFTRVADEVEY